MRSLDQRIILDSIEFAGRWGFLTQEIFFDFMCPMSKAQQYRYWSALVKQGYFKKSKSTSKNLILSPKVRAQMDKDARPARHYFYIEHDAAVARFFLSLEKRNLIREYWLEYDLASDPLNAYSILGCQSLKRIPDIIFDLKSGDRSIRCALEIERTTKSQARYRKVSLSYLDMRNIDLVLFGCARISTERAVRKAFGYNVHIVKGKFPGTFQYDKFDANSLKTEITFHQSMMSVERFLEIITKSSVPKLQQAKNKSEMSDSFQIDRIQEVA